ncbi:hypothetical protein V2A60_008400 [Cordyceps javanica]
MPVKEPAVTAKAQRRRKAPTLREHDWEPLKTRIVDLHIKENMSLPDVRALMQKERGFEATLRQYRSRISHWGLDKNVKKKEMHFIARKYNEMKIRSKSNSTYTFRVRGKIVPRAKIRRWVERTGPNRTDAIQDSASTPSDVSYWSDCEEQTSGAGQMLCKGPEADQKAHGRSVLSEQETSEEFIDDPIRNRLASLVRYRQTSAADSPVYSLRDLYRQEDLSSLLGSLEIDDVLVGPYTADAEDDSLNELNRPHSGFAPDLHTSVTDALSGFEIAQKAQEGNSRGKLTSLVQNFFENAHHFVPVLDKQDFLQRWHSDREAIPPATRSAIYSLAEILNGVPENAMMWFQLARAYSALTVPVATVDFSLGLHELDADSASTEDLQFTQLARLATLTLPDLRLQSDAAAYLARHMRLLESCHKLWPSPELASQVKKLRELLADSAPKDLRLDATFWSEDANAAAHAQELMSDWLGPEDVDGSDVNSWIDAFL